MDTDKLFKELTKELKEINKANRQSRRQNQGYNTTRFTTPDVAGFRAFFSTAIGESFIDAVEDEGFLGALNKGLDKVFGRDRYEEIDRTAQQQLNKIQSRETAFLKELADLLELGRKGLPGGITAQTAYRRRQQFEEEVTAPARANILEDQMRATVAQRIRVFRNLSTAVVGASAALIVFRESLIEEAQQIGGVSLDQALRNRISRYFETFQSIFSNQGFVSSRRIAATQGAISGEFGRVISPEAAKELVQAAQLVGVSVNNLVKLERALQGTGMEATETINQFKAVGIGGQIAAQELAKNADAVARAGGNFNEYIVRGIANAKRLGLEFGAIEDTLTGFATDFEGTITSFSELRAVLPGFAVDFEQLMSTALTGTPDEFVQQVRSSLQAAGITDISGVNRAVLAGLEQATGFGAAELQRILENEDPYVDQSLKLDTDRNQMLNKIYVAIIGLGGAAVGSKLLGGVFGRGLGTVLGGAIGSVVPVIGTGIGAALGGLLGQGAAALLGGGVAAGAAYMAPKMFDDFVFRPGQPPAKFSPDDTLIGVKDPSTMGGGTTVVNDYSALEKKVDELIMTMNDQTNVLRNGMSVRMTGLDKAIIRKSESVIRG